MADYASTAQEAVEDDPVFTNEGTVYSLINRIDALDIGSLPHSYKSNSTKEELALEYVENFRRQFVGIFPKRAPLLLFPKNECGIRKLICSTVRPTQLPYKELYDIRSCSQFVSGFIDFEPLADPYQVPKIVPSPTMVLKSQVGDSFGFAVLLASFLLGSGYDAYVVSGYAPKWMTLRDESRQICPMLETDVLGQTEESKGSPRAGAAGRRSSAGSKDASGLTNPAYELKPHGIPKSQFIEMLETRAKEEEAAAARRKEAEGDLVETYEDEGKKSDDDEDQKLVHAWVMVGPIKRGIKETLFVEPSTGRFYRVQNSPYVGVESVWNHRNYWVNVQDETTSVNEQGFDLSDSDNWEYVFIDNLGKGNTKNSDDPEGTEEGTGDPFADDAQKGSPRSDASPKGSPRSMAEGKIEDDDVEEREQILDMPPSWVGKLSIPREKVALRYGKTGCRVVLYERAKMEVFAPGANKMGLLTRLTTFRDLMRTIPLEVREDFSSRKDKLYRRVRFPLKGTTHEYFLPGRKTGLKHCIDQPGRSLELLFYLTARLDGKTRRVEKIGRSITEYFENRDDYLNYRKVVLDRSQSDEGQKRGNYVLPSGQLGDLLVTKMNERFDRNPSVNADDDVQERTYHLADQRCVCVYHYGENNIRCSTREYYKDENRTPSEAFAAKFDPGAREEEVEAIWAKEKALHQDFKDAGKESRDILQHRKNEENKVELDRSVFETARERAKEEASKQVQEDKVEEPKDERMVDYLTPFLHNFATDPKVPTQEEAAKSRAACLAALKERLLERANIIQRRLDEENSALSKKQANFQRSRDHMEGADEAFEKFCSEAMFRISILEQRLSRHEETALQKYASMDQKLRDDPRLEVLNSGI
jgi:hypothetical protein